MNQALYEQLLPILEVQLRELKEEAMNAAAIEHILEYELGNAAPDEQGEQVGNASEDAFLAGLSAHLQTAATDADKADEGFGAN